MLNEKPQSHSLLAWAALSHLVLLLLYLLVENPRLFTPI